MSAVDVSVDTREAVLVNALRNVGGRDVRVAARKAARQAMAPAVEQVKREALALPGLAPHGDFRTSIAAAVTSTATVRGVTVRVRGARLGSRRNLPVKLDRGQPWRAPLFGNRTRWYTHNEAGRGSGWFSGTLSRRRGEVRKSVLDAVDTAVRAQLGMS